MNYLLSMFAVLLIGVTILMSGIIMMDKEFEETSQHTIMDSMAWGFGFFVSFAAEFLMLANVV